jgi:hypothetical protein
MGSGKAKVSLGKYPPFGGKRHQPVGERFAINRSLINRKIMINIIKFTAGRCFILTGYTHVRQNLFQLLSL